MNETPGESLQRILAEFGIVRTKPPTVDEKANYEMAAAFFMQAGVTWTNANSQNEGLPCTCCGHKPKQLQIDADRENGLLNVRINGAFAKESVVKQAKGLAQLFKQFAEGL